MGITGRQIRQLRGLANHLEATVTIGKAGIVDSVVNFADNALSRVTHSALVQVIGHKFVLYRPSKRDDIEHIELVK